MSSVDEQVLAANQRFYDAFVARDAAAMDRLWAVDHPVACVHPGWTALLDRESVLRSWRLIFRSRQPIEVKVEGASVLQVSESVAMVVCYERLSGTGRESNVVAATNLFVRERDEWKIAHHHAGPVYTEEPDADEPAPRGGHSPLN